MNYRAACHSPSIFLGICLLGADLICCAGWAPLAREAGESTTGLCRVWGQPSPFLPCLPHPHHLLDQRRRPRGCTQSTFTSTHCWYFYPFGFAVEAKSSLLGTIWPPLPQGSRFVSVAEPLLQVRDTPKVRSVLDKTAAQRGSCGSGWVSYSLPVRHGNDSPSISLLDLPKSWMAAFLPRAEVHTNASLPLDPWQLHTHTHYPGTLLLTKRL